MDIVEQVTEYCLDKMLIAKGDKILLAVSGGPDSVALLNIFHELQNKLHIELSVVHFEHGLRGHESVKDQEFVKRMADKLGLSFYTKSMNVLDNKRHDESVEEAARRMRLSYFLDVLKDIGYNKIATGHTSDDNVETVLFRLISGTGPAGISGILPISGKVIHPILSLTREQIMRYLAVKKLQYREDETNFDRSITRNKIRHEIIPILYSINPRYREHIQSFATIIKEENELVHTIAMNMLESVLLNKRPGNIEVSYTRFLDLSPPLKRRIILWAVRFLAESQENDEYERKYIPYKIVNYISQSKDVGNKTIYKDKFLEISKEYDVLLFKKRVVNKNDKTYLYYVEEITNPIHISEINRKIVLRVRDHVERLKKNNLYFDYNKITFPLIVRGRKTGDRIELVGLGNKKVKTIFINEKIPRAGREMVPIIESSGKICGIFLSLYGKENRCAEEFMISESTERILECELI
ncbi:MAG: tRNA lysidine(34) synthetase TilS [Spirochaetota bacterium]|nr:MAG: tRNA lysidine(34) synthetase TilS [Spirochaetota bacterium]